MMQEMKRIVTEKDDDRPVAHRSQIERVGDKGGDGIMLLDERHQDKLDDEEEDVDGEKSADPHIEAIAEF